MIEGRIEAAGRESIRPYLFAWLVACLILGLANFRAVSELSFPDPDDTLRLMQVRDWLAGQSWFDLRQYRMNAPEGAPMHWSRIVDLPIAGVIIMLRPLLGTTAAEIAALVIVPLLTLGVVMALVAAVTRRLLDHDHAVLAAFLVPVPVAVAHQLKPMRIDHHGWQMALAMAALLAMLDPDRRRSGLVAGAMAAIWLAISLEGLPFAVGLIALCAIRWLVDPREGERLAYSMAALAGVSVLLFALTKDAAGWAATFCDAVSPIHLAVLAIGAVGTALLVTLRPAGTAPKLAGLALIAAAAGGVMLAVAPQCGVEPFNQLDPLVYEFWYLNVDEGLPVWRQQPLFVLLNLSFPLIGLAGSWIMLRGSQGDRRTAWAVTIFLLGAAFVTALFVQRASSVANLFALPGGVALARMMLLRARDARSLPLRVGTMAAVVAIIAPGHVISFAGTILTSEARAGTKSRPSRCLVRSEIEALNQLPPSDFATPLDIGPSIMVRTSHRIIASGHHRNAAAMADTIRIFSGAPEAARALLARRSIDFIAVCPGLPETAHYKRRAPDGLWSRLESGRGPDWLEPVRLPGVTNLRIWRVKPAG